MDEVFSKEPTIIRNRFARLVFSVTRSPFLLNGVFRKHVENFRFSYGFVQTVLNPFYVDDFTGDANTPEEIYELFKNLKLRFLECAFNLRKLQRNDITLTKLIDAELDQNYTPSKILGIFWNEKADTSSFKFEEICELARLAKSTQQNILKTLLIFYNPTGRLQPIIINLKLIFKNICRLKLHWDEELPGNIKKDWENIIDLLCKTQNNEIPRKVIHNKLTKSVELHGLVTLASKDTEGVFISGQFINRAKFL